MTALADRIGVGPADLERIRDVERQLLGACMWSGIHGTDGLDSAAETVTSEDFATYAHRVVFDVMLDLRRANTPVTAATVFERLHATGKLVELGHNPKEWIAETATLQGSDIGAAEYAGLVREASSNRRLKRAVLEMSAVVQNPARPAAVAQAECEQILFDAGPTASNSGPRGANALVREALDRIDRVASGAERPGLLTGFTDLDAFLGGLKPGQLIPVAARPALGKTALGLALATNATRAGVPALFVSLEMTRTELMERVLAMRSGVRLRLIQTGQLDSHQAGLVDSAGQVFAKEPFFLEDATPMSAARLASITRRYVRQYGLRLLVVDYLGLMEPENTNDSRVHQVGLLSRRLKELAKSCSIPVVVLAQLNRECEGRPDGRPRLSDLRDSGEVEQDADAVVLLHRSRGQADDADVWMIEADVAKNRNGPVGVTALAYCRAITRFANAARP